VGNAPDDGVDEQSVLVATVSPNPVSSKVTIGANANEGEVTVFDMMGRQVTKVMLHEGQAVFDISNFAQGVYIARITSDRGVSEVKLVKE
jgi:hypothetical protein